MDIGLNFTILQCKQFNQLDSISRINGFFEIEFTYLRKIGGMLRVLKSVCSFIDKNDINF